MQLHADSASKCPTTHGTPLCVCVLSAPQRFHFPTPPSTSSAANPEFKPSVLSSSLAAALATLSLSLSLSLLPLSPIGPRGRNYRPTCRSLHTPNTHPKMMMKTMLAAAVVAAVRTLPGVDPTRDGEGRERESDHEGRSVVGKGARAAHAHWHAARHAKRVVAVKVGLGGGTAAAVAVAGERREGERSATNSSNRERASKSRGKRETQADGCLCAVRRTVTGVIAYGTRCAVREWVWWSMCAVWRSVARRAACVICIVVPPLLSPLSSCDSLLLLPLYHIIV